MPINRAGRQMRNQRVSNRLEQSDIGTPILKIGRDRVQTHLSCDCEISSPRAVGPASKSRRADKQRSASGDIIGQLPDFTVRYSLTRETDYNGITRQAIGKQTPRADICLAHFQMQFPQRPKLP